MNGFGNTAREHRLLEQATKQFGLLTYADLLDAGLSPDAITGRLRTARLTRLHHCVYVFGHAALREEAHWLAALWACGEGAVLSHASAAAYHRWTPQPPDEPIHITTTRAIRSRPGIVVHPVRRLEKVDVFRSHPFAVTTMPRTLVDLADVTPWDDFRELADGLPSLRVDRIRQAQARAPFRVGSPLVTRLVAADDAHTKSEFERRYLRFAAAHGLPRPDELNVRVAGHKADCVHRTPRLVIELDGRAFHRRRAQMRADRHRDTDYQLAGYRILRLVWDDLHPDEAGRTAARVRAMLAAGRDRD
jgi:hypothetical protein